MEKVKKTVYVLTGKEDQCCEKDLEIIEENIFNIFDDDSSFVFNTENSLNDTETLAELLEQSKDKEDYLVIMLEGGNYYWHGKDEFEMLIDLLRYNKDPGKNSWTILADIIGKKIPVSRIPKQDTADLTDLDRMIGSTWIRHMLENQGINTMQELAGASDEQKVRLVQIGREGFDKLNSALAECRYEQWDYDDAFRKYEQMPIPIDLPLENLNISMRTFDCLIRAGYNRVKDLLESDGAKIVTIRNLGRKYYNEIADIMINRLDQPKERWEYDSVKPQNGVG